MDVETALHDATFVDENRGRADVACDDARRLQFGALRGEDVAGHCAANDHFTSRHVADNRRALANHHEVSASNRAFQPSINAKRALGLDVAAHGDVRIERGEVRAGDWRRVAPAEQAHGGWFPYF